MSEYIESLKTILSVINIFLQTITNSSMDLINSIINSLGLDNNKGFVYLIIFFVIYKILLEVFMRSNKYFVIFFEFPGTVIHEISHAVLAIITGGKIIKFTVFPKFEKDRIILGSVEYSVKTKNFVPFVSTAPLYLNTIILICIFKLLISDVENFHIFNNFYTFLLTYFSVVVISSSILSIQDLSSFFNSMFNYVFISFILIFVIIIKFFNINIFIFINNMLNQYVYIISNSILFLILFSIILILIKLIANVAIKK